MNYYTRYRSQGLCGQCGEPAEGFYCKAHAAERALRERTARKNQRLRNERIKILLRRT